MPEQEHNREYLERRRRESAERAKTASDPSIARIHRTFADQYSERLKGFSEDGAATA